MTSRILSGALVLVAGPMLFAGDPQTSVHLVARPAPDEQTRTSYGKALEEARAKRAALRADLEKQHGKKEKSWPADARARYDAAKEAEERADDSAWYGGNVQQDQDDTLRDLTEAMGKKDRLKIVASPQDAHLVVEILGRGRGRYGGGMNAGSHIGLRLTSGRLLEPSAVRQLKWEFTAGLQKRMAAFESEDPPSVAVEILGIGRAWRLSTTKAADEIDYMVKKNREVLGATR
jgi:hypothetical protein